MNKSIFLPSCMMILLSTASIGQIVKPDLSDAGNFEFANRAFDMKKDDSKGPVVYLKSAEGPGVVWLRDTWFSTGTLEFDVKGKEVLQKSFVGLAFHAQNDSTYEGIYFRPFNFQTTDTLRRKHFALLISTVRKKYAEATPFNTSSCHSLTGMCFVKMTPENTKILYPAL